MAADATKSTVLVALFANLGVGAVKAVGGVLTGSSALVAEAAHSVADTLNELFLLLSLGRASQPADRTHPFGYGKERFFWSLLAAVGIFVSGAVFSVAEGLQALFAGGKEETSTREFLIIYGVLAISFLLEGYSLSRAVRQVRQEAKDAQRQLITYIVRSPDPTVKTVASEDTIAVLGVFVALVGTALHQLTGAAYWDGGASIVIGLLLAYVAYVLGRDTKELLIGEAADPAVRLRAYEIIVARPEVVAVQEMLTMQLGPDSVLVAARLQFDEQLTAGELERVCTQIQEKMHEQVHSLTQVFLDPSRATTDDADRVQRVLTDTVEEVQDIYGKALPEDRLRALRTRTGRRLQSGSTPPAA